MGPQPKITGAWRQMSRAQRAVALGVLAMLVAVIFASGSVAWHALAHPAGSQAAAQSHVSHIRDEGQSFQLRHFGSNVPAPDARIKALRQVRALPRSPLGAAPHGAALPALPTSTGTWIPLGPQPIDTGTPPAGYGLDSGRITAVAVDPTDGQSVWVGAADGGLWHSADGGQHWTSVSDTTQVTFNGVAGPWPTLSIGAIAVDPKDHHTIYVGTGEANGNQDAYWGVGILKSTDGGATWTQYGFAEFGALGVAKIAIDPFASTHVMAAIGLANQLGGGPPGDPTLLPWENVGIWNSTDSGVTWTKIFLNSNTAVPGTDVVFDPARQGVVYLGYGQQLNGIDGTQAGVWVSNVLGTGFQQVTTIPNGQNVERVSLGISSDGSHVYAALTDGSASATFGNLINHAIYGSSNGGATWSAIDVSGVPGMTDDDGVHQWWYDSYIAVDPADANTFYAGGVDLWQAHNGVGSGCPSGKACANWTNLTNVYADNSGPVHPDEHALTFLPGLSSYYLGTDGGVWSGTKAGTFTDLNAGGLNITQFYAGGIGEVGTHAQLYGGAQDNGLAQYPGIPLTALGPSQWTEVFGGDGVDTAVDYTNNANVYVEGPFESMFKSTNGGASWRTADFNHDGNGFPGCTGFIEPLLMSPSNPNLIITATDRIFRSTDGTAHWSTISPRLSHSAGCNEGINISALALAPSNNNYIYASVGSDIFVTTNGGASWIERGGVSSRINSIDTSLAVDPTDPNVVYVTFPGFLGGPGLHIFKSTDAGVTWNDISTSLPDAPFESVVVSPANYNLVFAGSDVGIFASTDGGASWSVLGTGLPPTTVNSIFLNHTGSELYVATHGRGMWAFALPHLGTDPAALAATTAVGGKVTQTFAVTNTGTGPLSWSVTSAPSWLAVSPMSGTVLAGQGEQVTATFDTTGMSFDATQTGTLTLASPNADNPTLSVPVTLVTANLAQAWSFAEGTTAGSFQTYISVTNPNATVANVVYSYYLDSGQQPIRVTKVVPPNSRATENVNTDIGSGHAVSMTVASDVGIVAERPMYFTFRGIPGGTDILGATGYANTFDFGYLDTTPGHTTFLTILNPDALVDMDAQVTFFPASGGTPISFTRFVPHSTRGTIGLNTDVPGLAPGVYSATVSLFEHGQAAPLEGLVERPMYLKDSVTGYTGSADVMGVPSTQTAWYFAEGTTNSTFSERYILSNPCLPADAGGCGATPPADPVVTFYMPDGSTKTATATLAPGQQQVIDANKVLGNGVANSALVTAKNPILAERFMSFSYHGIPGATDVLGASAPRDLFFFAEGATTSSFTEFLTIENPGTQAAIVNVTFLPADGSAPIVRTYTVNANSRFTLKTNDVISGSFSMVVESNGVPIVAERPMYFVFHGSDTGGTDIIGYEP